MGRRGINVLMVLAISFFLMSFVSAACPEGGGYLGNKELNECVRITQTCATCTSVNISSITLTTSNQTLNSNISMTDFGNGEWIYHFCNTSQFGNYFIQGQGNLNGVDTSFKSCFDIGQNMTVPEAIMYVVFLAVLFGILTLMSYFIVILPGENAKNDQDVVIGIVKLKYVKIFLIAMCYPLILIILNLMTGLAVNFASIGMFAGVIGFLFEMMFRLAWPFTIVIVLWILYLLVKDSNVMRNINKLGRFKLNG